MVTAAAWVDRAARLETELLHMVPDRDRRQARALVNELIEASAMAFAHWERERLDSKEM